METDQLQYPFSIAQFFIPEFITRLRRRREVTEKPSPRQSIAMCELLLPAYMRKGHVSFGDLVRIAVITSKVDNQDIAEKLAYQILLEVEETEEPPFMEDEAYLGLISEKSDDLINYFPSEEEKAKDGEYQPVHDSSVDLFREFTSQPDIGVGPGEDELAKAAVRKYKYRKDEESRRRLAEFLKEKLLKLGREFQQSVEIQRKPILRPFEYGDDPEDIDEERSLENIFDQGKTMDEVAYDDFLIRKRDKKKKAIVFILDISNTMFYELEGLTSIHYSVLSLVPLLWSLRQEKYGLIFYESNSHIQKDLQEELDADEIIDALLLLVTASTGDVERSIRGTRGAQTWGGTVPTMSLKWATDQLEASGERMDRICFYFSDFVLQDPSDAPQLENYRLIGRMVGQGMSVVACVSPLANGKIFSPYTKDTLERVRQAGAKIIETGKPLIFLEEVQDLLESL